MSTSICRVSILGYAEQPNLYKFVPVRHFLAVRGLEESPRRQANRPQARQHRQQHAGSPSKVPSALDAAPTRSVPLIFSWTACYTMARLVAALAVVLLHAAGALAAQQPMQPMTTAQIARERRLRPFLTPVSVAGLRSPHAPQHETHNSLELIRVGDTHVWPDASIKITVDKTNLAAGEWVEVSWSGVSLVRRPSLLAAHKRCFHPPERIRPAFSMQKRTVAKAPRQPACPCACASYVSFG